MKVHLHMGAMADPIEKQLAKQGLALKLNDGKKGHYQRVADSITFLSIHGYIAQKAAHTARGRLLRNVMEGVEPASGAPRSAA